MRPGQGVAGGEGAAVELDGAAGDGEAEADAAAGAAAVGIDAVEGVEDAAEGVLGNAGAAVADEDGGLRAVAAEGDVDGGSGRRVADGVADDVFNGAAEEFGVAGEIDAGDFGDVERAVLRGGFDAAVVDDVGEQIVEAEEIAVLGGGVAFGASDFEEASDELVEAAGLAFDAIEGGGGVLVGAGEFDGDAQAGEGAAKFVGDVEEETALGGEQGFDAPGHAVEGAGELAEFVVAFRGDAGGEVAAAEAVDGALELADGRTEVIGEGVTEQDGEAEDPEVFHAEEPEGAAAAGAGDQDEEIASVVGGRAMTGRRMKMARRRRWWPGRSEERSAPVRRSRPSAR